MLGKDLITELLLITLMCCVVFTEDEDLFESTERLSRRALRRQRLRPKISFPRRPRITPPAQIGPVPDFEPPAAVTDPADIVHMLGRCSGGNFVRLADVFQGMFVSNAEADTIVTEAKSALKNTNSNKNSFIETNRMSKTIGRSNPGHNPHHSRDNSGCCATEMRMTAPLTVLENGRRMRVVHMNSSYQFVHEGVCVSPRAKCRDHGECVQVYKYSYMLLYDPGLINMFPPVRFGRIQVKSHCECMNIGV